MAGILISLVLLTFMAVTAFYVLRLRHLFSVVMLTGVFSLLSAALFTNLDAVDVAFTEAAVGGGISTVLMLGTLALTRRREKVPETLSIGPLIIALVTGAALVYGTLDMPRFGDPNAPALKHVVPEYIEGTANDVSMPNIVTAVLASYRGYDTLGETAVIFTAGIGVLLLLVWRREEDEEDEDGEKEDRA
ncbi:MAG: DUF4040 domain-containing protein [Rhodospirillaceae bacterium]|nr:DUF4040 domain-containing protein [Rhodospirillaceae bacterium]MBT6137532.1 DUF4040 domain-containing protein [Rhodospirillaceae bacterium]